MRRRRFLALLQAAFICPPLPKPKLPGFDGARSLMRRATFKIDRSFQIETVTLYVSLPGVKYHALVDPRTGETVREWTTP